MVAPCTAVDATVPAIVNVLDAAGRRLATEHVTTPAANPQPGGSAPTFTVKPAGTGSVTTIPVAVEGPALDT